MATEDRASLTKFSLPSLDVQGAYHHSSEITRDTSDAVADMIVQDALDNHVFFKRLGLHNHLIHIILADYSLGASKDRLRALYKAKSPRQLPIQSERGIKDDFSWDSKHCLGDQDYYQSYLAFFQEEVKSLGIKDAVEKYIFGGKAEMLERFVSGAYHPMIHTGYGIEFDIPMMVAEGLAQTAVHNSSVTPLFADGKLESYATSLYNNKEKKTKTSMTPLELASKAQQDSRFEGLISFEESPKFKKILQKTAARDLITEYVLAWNIPDTSQIGLLEQSGSLMALAAACYAGPQRRNQAATLDFFLMHGLTSSLFLPSMIQLLSTESSVRLLVAKFAVDLTYYASRARPMLDLTQFAGTSREWPEMIAAAIKHDDEHVPKALRALAQAERYDSKHELAGLAKDSSVYRSMAALTLEADGHWNQDGIGFDEVWKNVPELSTPRNKVASSAL